MYRKNIKDSHIFVTVDFTVMFRMFHDIKGLSPIIPGTKKKRKP